MEHLSYLSLKSSEAVTWKCSSQSLRVNLLSAEAGLEQLRPLWSSQVWEGSQLAGGSVVSTPGRGPRGARGVEAGVQAGRQGGEMAASPDKVYHERQRWLGKTSALFFTQGSLPHCQVKRQHFSGGRWLKRARISNMWGRGQEIGGLKAKKCGL